MFLKPFITFAIVILVLSPTFTYSTVDISGDCNDESCCFQLAHQVCNDHHSRCASIFLNNKSGYNMSLVANNLEDGRWLTSKDYIVDNSVNIKCEPHSLSENESETISSVTSHFLGGVKGYVSFKIADNLKSEFTISWKVPTIGPPLYEFNFLNNLSYHHYDVIKEIAFEDTVYQIAI